LVPVAPALRTRAESRREKKLPDQSRDELQGLAAQSIAAVRPQMPRSARPCSLPREWTSSPTPPLDACPAKCGIHGEHASLDRNRQRCKSNFATAKSGERSGHAG